MRRTSLSLTCPIGINPKYEQQDAQPYYDERQYMAQQQQQPRQEGQAWTPQHGGYYPQCQYQACSYANEHVDTQHRSQECSVKEKEVRSTNFNVLSQKKLFARHTCGGPLYLFEQNLNQFFSCTF